MGLIKLSDRTPIARGDHRECYHHPLESDKCIKVLHEDWREINRRKNDPLRIFRSKAHFHENLTEAKELKKIEKRCGSHLVKHFPRSHGFVATDLGEGLVVDFIRDHDGRPAQTLKSYIWEHGYDRKSRTAIEEFWTFLFDHAVIVRDPDPYNICLAEDANGTLTAYLIDGYGRSDFLPFVEWFPNKTRKKLSKRRARFNRSVDRILEMIAAGLDLSGKGVVRRDLLG